MFNSLGLSSSTHSLQIYCIGLIGPTSRTFWAWTVNQDPTVAKLVFKFCKIGVKLAFGFYENSVKLAFGLCKIGTKLAFEFYENSAKLVFGLCKNSVKLAFEFCKNTVKLEFGLYRILQKYCRCRIVAGFEDVVS